MRRLKLSIVLCLLFFANLYPSTEAFNPSSGQAAELGHPDQAYVHLSMTFFVDLVSGAQRVAAVSAGGVCVESDESGCFVLTVNHFCQRSSSDEPSIPGFYAVISAENMNGGASSSVEVLDTMPEADLCLLRVEGSEFASVRGVILPEVAPRFAEIKNYGAPAGHFNASNYSWNLSMYEGRWAGYCTERCRIPDERVDNVNLIAHTLPTTRGQSGSGLFVGDGLFGVQVATNASIEDFGIAASSRSIYLFLQRNEIHLELLSLEKQW